MTVTVDPPGYGTADDPHGWLWLSRVRAATAAAAPSGSASADPTDAGFDVVAILGQSNALGTNSGGDPLLDYTDPRVLVAPSSGPRAGQLAVATDPLPHPQSATTAPPATGYSVGPAVAFGRWQATVLPSNRRILLVPCSVGGTAFTDAGGGTGNVWDADGTANLYTGAVALIRAALATAPGARLAAVLWVQGEGNEGTAASTYQARLETLIGRLRADLSAPRLPFLIGSMVPDWVDGGTGRQAVAAVHAAVPTRVPFTAYAWGPRLTVQPDGIHYTSAGARQLGYAIWKALAAAQANTAGGGAALTPLPAPTGVAQTAATGSTVTLAWEAVPTASAYRVEQVDGDAVTARQIVAASPATLPGISGSTGARVSAWGPAGWGTASDPVTLTTSTGSTGSTGSSGGTTAPTRTAGNPDKGLVPLRGTAAYGGGKFGQALTGGVLTEQQGLWDMPATDATIEAWVRTTAAGSIVATGSDASGYFIGLNSGRFWAYDHDTLRTADAGGLNDGQWHHLALVLSGTTSLMFADGQLVRTNTDHAPAAIRGAWQRWGVGGWGDIASYDWTDGAIDEVRLSSAVRYTAAFTPPTAPFVADASTVALWGLDGDGTNYAA